MKLRKKEIRDVLDRWLRAWDEHDLKGIMAVFGDDILFENWTGIRIEGKAALEKAWKEWFAFDGGFTFIAEDIFIDEDAQKVLFRWEYHGRPLEKGSSGEEETRRGVDILHFRDGRIAAKLTYCKTSLHIDGKRSVLKPV